MSVNREFGCGPVKIFIATKRFVIIGSFNIKGNLACTCRMGMPFARRVFRNFNPSDVELNL